MQPNFESLQNILNFDVSLGAYQKLENYHALLLKWQKAINLVSPKTLQNAWERHFLDSAQVLNAIPQGQKTIADIGSGGGFAGLVVAILRPDCDVHLIESDERKCQFLKTVSRETSTNVSVHTVRVEHSYDLCAPDIVSARALAHLTDLLDFAYPWIEQNPNLRCVFMKGQNADHEISAAQQRYEFSCESCASVTDPEAKILQISEIKRK